jgi:hypothetical protein
MTRNALKEGNNQEKGYKKRNNAASSWGIQWTMQWAKERPLCSWGDGHLKHRILEPPAAWLIGVSRFNALESGSEWRFLRRLFGTAVAFGFDPGSVNRFAVSDCESVAPRSAV